MKLIRPTNFSFIVLLTLFVATLSSCKFGQVYTYDIRLERPVQSQHLNFENDTISISFAFGEDDIQFELYNKLDDALKINWRDISASINGETKIISALGYPRALLIAPRSKIRDYLKIYDRSGYSDTGVAPIGMLYTYPIRDNNWEPYKKYILGLKGRKITIYLPYYIRDIYCSKTFEFVIADVQPKPQPQKNRRAK
jgi:hypothetical protein